MPTVYDALIVGAGPAGATAAILLAEAGWSVALVEKAPFPRRKVCGEFLSATNLPLLRRLGVAERYEAEAGPAVRDVGLYAGDHVVTSVMPRATASTAASISTPCSWSERRRLAPPCGSRGRSSG
jgi:2-polyprenyl-6-methoxyphenol hydroxylase-like FAD-dependent oxidoreductase